MTEDRSFNEFLKAKLEEDVGELPEVAALEGAGTTGTTETTGTNGTTGTVFGFLRPSYLVAASLAVVCGVSAVVFSNVREKSREREAVCAIEFLDAYQNALAANDEGSSLAGAETFAEKLLAWQDAPYDEIVN